jgi:MFS family permease
MMTTYLLQAAGVLVLANVQTIGQVYVFLVIFGIGYGGAIPTFIAMRGEYFGRKAFATIQGIMRLFLMVPTVIGPVFAGYIYDTTGSYNSAFMLFAVLYVLGAAVIFFARRPRRRNLVVA